MTLIPIYVKETTTNIPADAVYVAPNGLPGNAGTVSSPKDLVSGYNATPTNGTLVLSGTLATPYRQSLVVTRKINIVAKPGDSPVIEGSMVLPVSDFVLESDNTYFKENYVPAIAPLDFTPAIDPDVPQASNLLQVFVDGVYFKQVATKAQLVNNSFFVGNGRLYLRGAIAGKRIEVSSKNVGITINAFGTRVSGITVAKFGTYGIIINADNVVLNKVNTFFNAYRGIFAQSGSDIKFEDVGAYYNGSTGIHVGTNTRNFKFDVGQLIGNNIAGFANYMGAAGIKLVGQFGGLPLVDFGERYIKNVTVEGSGTHGIWLDGNVKGLRVTRNIVSNCLAGIHVEISDENFVVNNICFNNGIGVLVNNTKNTVVANNTLVLNNRSIAVKGGSRVNPDVRQRNAGIDWVPRNNIFFNNIHDRSKSNECMIDVETTVSSPDAIATMEYNAYNRDSASKPILMWKRTGSAYEFYSDLGTFREDNPSYEQGSIGRTGVTTDTSHPFFVAGTFDIKPSSPTVAAGKPVTGVVAELMGVEDNTVVGMGANFSTVTETPELPTDPCDVRIEDAVSPLRFRVNALNDDLNAANARIAELEASATPNQNALITQLTAERDTARLQVTELLSTIAGIKNQLTATINYIN